MNEGNVVAFHNPEAGIEDPLTALLRAEAERLLHPVVEQELIRFLEGFAGQVDAQGRAAVVRNGHLPAREILTGIGPVRDKVPKVRSRIGAPVVFRSALVLPYVRKAKSVEAALPWLYLKGISTGQMQEALAVLVGPEANGQSVSVVSRFKTQWQAEYAAWCERWLDQGAEG